MTHRTAISAILALLCAMLLSSPGAAPAQSLQYHLVSANEWLYPDTPIPASPVQAMELHSARGGRAGFQVLLRGLSKGDPLVCKFEGGLAPEIYQLIDVKVPENSGPPCSAIPPDQPKPDYVIRKAPYRVYEALRPMRDGDPARGETDALYVSFRVPRDAKAGQQKGLLRIRGGKQSVAIDVALTIYAASVPEQGHLRVTNWFSTSHMARLHKVEPWSEPHWDLLRQYAQMMRRGRQTDFIPVGPERKKLDDGRWQFDFSRTERMIRMFFDEGFTHIELPHIASHDRRKEAVAPFVVDVDGKPTPGTSHEAYEFLAQYLSAWARDAPAQRLVRPRQSSTSSTNQRPKISTTTASWPAPCANSCRECRSSTPLATRSWTARSTSGCRSARVTKSTGKVSKRIAGAAIRSGSIPAAHRAASHLNRFIDTELLRTRLLHWANWRYRLDGYLHWGLNQVIPEQDPFENTTPPHGPYHDFHLPPGDSHIVYPGTDGPWSSVRFEAMGAGIEDYELLRVVAAARRKAR